MSGAARVLREDDFCFAAHKKTGERLAGHVAVRRSGGITGLRVTRAARVRHVPLRMLEDLSVVRHGGEP